jgi:DNA-binding beta-propeller fold protein YncE
MGSDLVGRDEELATSGDGQFNFAVGVATDAAGNVYVADENNNRMQKLKI